MRALVAAGAFALLLAGSPVAFACEGSVGLLNDTFDALSPIWSATTDISVDDGKLEINTRPDKSEKITADPKFGDIDACADVIVVKASDLAAAYVGIGFWMTDNANLYTFQITLDGYAGVYRLSHDKWDTLIKDKQSSSIVTGIGSVNTIRVVTVGNQATFYINGDKFDTLTGTPPDDGQHVGFVVEGPEKESATFKFDDMNVTYPEGQ